MSDKRILDAIFCDDIRQEVQNKYSLNGVYVNSINFPEFPVTVAKLCVHAKLITPKHLPSTRVSFHTTVDGRRINSLPVDSKVVRAALDESLPSDTTYTMVAMLVMSPFTIDRECDLSIECDVDEETVKSVPIHVRNRLKNQASKDSA